MSNNASQFYDLPADSLNMVFALSWWGYQKLGRGIVVCEINLNGSSKFRYLGSASKELHEIVSRFDDGLPELLETYDPREGFLFMWEGYSPFANILYPFSAPGDVAYVKPGVGIYAPSDAYARLHGAADGVSA